MLAGPLVAEAAAGLDGVIIDRVVAHPVVASDAATMFALNLATIRHDPLPASMRDGVDARDGARGAPWRSPLRRDHVAGEAGRHREVTSARRRTADGRPT